jgi:nicotinate dehydrogenase subunit B
MIAEPLSRRRALESAGALIVAFSLGGRAASAADVAPSPRSTAFTRVESWLAIDRNGRVAVYTGKIDMGNGMETAYLQIVADELDVPIEHCDIIQGSTALTPDQGKSTASSAIGFSVQPLRVAAAEARNALVQQAAQKLNLPASDLTTDAGFVHPKADASRRIAYGALVTPRLLAIDMELGTPNPFSATLKEKTPLQSYKKLNAVGKPILRRDVPAKVAGTFEYVQNVRVPGMLHGRVVRGPAPGATLLTLDETSIAGVPGARVVRRGNFLGVVAPKEADAIRAVNALKTTWKTPSAPGTPAPTNASLYDDLRKAQVLGSYEPVKIGDADAVLAGKTKKLTAQYNFPYQMHGMIGPSCAVADVRPDGATLWSGSQWPQGTRNDVAKMLGLPPENVQLVWREASGSYGRMAADDALADAAVLSQIVGKPVRVQWMRHDEHGWEPISPAVALDVQGSLTDDGRVDAISMQYRAGSTAGAEAGGTLAWRQLGSAPGNTRLSGFPTEFPYDTIPAQHIKANWVAPAYRLLYMRAPGAQQGAFASEAFMDELAAAAAANPLDFRLKHISNERDRAVLQEAARLAAWDGKPSPTRGAPSGILLGRGVAQTRNGAKAQRMATVVEVAVNRSTGNVLVTHLWIAADVGLIINPDGLLNQIQGGALQGLSRTLKEEVKFDANGVVNTDWRSYPILKFSDVPEMRVSLLNRPSELPGGAGELGNASITAAVANAIFDATGKRIREAPFTAERIRALLV